MGHDQARDDVLKRILLIPSSYPPVLGGVQAVSHRIAEHLVSGGNQVAVLTRKHPKSLPASESGGGVEVTRCRFLPAFWELAREGRPDLAAVSAYHRASDRRVVRELLARFRPEIVNIHFPDWQVGLLDLIGEYRPMRLVVSLHGDEVMRAVRGEQMQIRRLERALADADRVTACSGWLLDQASSLVPGLREKAVVIWNGIEAGRFAEITPVGHGRPYILGFGRFVHKKGFDLLINAYADLGRPSDLDLVLVGSGPESTRLKALAADRSVADRVIFPGRVFESEMLGWISGARLVVIPSREEPFGLAALEAAAMGVPLLATSVGGLPEFLGGLTAKTGSVAFCEPEVAGIKERMAEMLICSEGRAVSVERAMQVRQEFSWEKRLAEFDEVLMSDEVRTPEKPGAE